MDVATLDIKGFDSWHILKKNHLCSLFGSYYVALQTQEQEIDKNPFPVMDAVMRGILNRVNREGWDIQEYFNFLKQQKQYLQQEDSQQNIQSGIVATAAILSFFLREQEPDVIKKIILCQCSTLECSKEQTQLLYLHVTILILIFQGVPCSILVDELKGRSAHANINSKVHDWFNVKNSVIQLKKETMTITLTIALLMRIDEIIKGKKVNRITFAFEGGTEAFIWPAPNNEKTKTLPWWLYDTTLHFLRSLKAKASADIDIDVDLCICVLGSIIGAFASSLGVLDDQSLPLFSMDFHMLSLMKKTRLWRAMQNDQGANQYETIVRSIFSPYEILAGPITLINTENVNNNDLSLDIFDEIQINGGNTLNIDAIQKTSSSFQRNLCCLVAALKQNNEEHGQYPTVMKIACLNIVNETSGYKRVLDENYLRYDRKHRDDYDKEAKDIMRFLLHGSQGLSKNEANPPQHLETDAPYSFLKRIKTLAKDYKFKLADAVEAVEFINGFTFKEETMFALTKAQCRAYFAPVILFRDPQLSCIQGLFKWEVPQNVKDYNMDFYQYNIPYEVVDDSEIDDSGGDQGHFDLINELIEKKDLTMFEIEREIIRYGKEAEELKDKIFFFAAFSKEKLDVDVKKYVDAIEKLTLFFQDQLKNHRETLQQLNLTLLGPSWNVKEMDQDEPHKQLHRIVNLISQIWDTTGAIVQLDDNERKTLQETLLKHDVEISKKINIKRKSLGFPEKRINLPHIKKVFEIMGLDSSALDANLHLPTTTIEKADEKTLGDILTKVNNLEWPALNLEQILLQFETKKSALDNARHHEDKKTKTIDSKKRQKTAPRKNTKDSKDRHREHTEDPKVSIQKLIEDTKASLHKIMYFQDNKYVSQDVHCDNYCKLHGSSPWFLRTATLIMIAAVILIVIIIVVIL